jgi:acetylornithine deacetylase/succinyl-diaminopimelate desuccinylase-like protein
MASRKEAVARAAGRVDDGRLATLLSQFVAARTDSPGGETAHLRHFLDAILSPWLIDRGFACAIHSNPDGCHGDLLIGERYEGEGLPTVLLYCHVDTVTCDATGWSSGLDPLVLTKRAGRWYGRGSADNKGQLAINLMALDAVLEARSGKLGCNLRLLAESGEEVGSPGLHAFCAAHRDALAADVMIASDGPRLSAAQPTIFLGSRGVVNVNLRVAPRSQPYHSGNWGGVLTNPATVLAHALAALVGPRGEILVEALRPHASLAQVKEGLALLFLPQDAGSSRIDEAWGEPGLTRAERLFGWNTLEVLAVVAGASETPANAIPPEARATVQLRCVAGTDVAAAPELIREHLHARGFTGVEVTQGRLQPLAATRTAIDQPWVAWACRSLERTLGMPAAVLPNIGGSIPNDAFAVLDVPTIWIPHSYPSCGQHGADEHLLESVAREGCAIMAGLFWDLGHRLEDSTLP